MCEGDFEVFTDIGNREGFMIENMLINYKFIDCEIEELRLQREMLLEDVGDIKGVNYDKVGSGSGVGSVIENTVLGKENKLNLIENQLKKLKINKKRIENGWRILEGREREFFKLRYEKGVKYDKIAEILDVEVSTVYAIRRRVLDKYSKLLGKY